MFFSISHEYSKKKKMKGFLPSIWFILLSLSQHKECHCEQAYNCKECLKSRLFLRCCYYCCCGCYWCCWWCSWWCCGHIGCYVCLWCGFNWCSAKWYSACFSAWTYDLVFNHWVESQSIAICCPEFHVAHKVYRR